MYIHATINTRPDGDWKARLKGVDLEVRGAPHQERYPEGTFWVCPDIEVQNPLTGTWHPLTNEALAEQARYEICIAAPGWNPEL